MPHSVLKIKWGEASLCIFKSLPSIAMETAHSLPVDLFKSPKYLTFLKNTLFFPLNPCYYKRICSISHPPFCLISVIIQLLNAQKIYTILQVYILNDAYQQHLNNPQSVQLKGTELIPWLFTYFSNECVCQSSSNFSKNTNERL